MSVLTLQLAELKEICLNCGCVYMTQRMVGVLVGCRGRDIWSEKARGKKSLLGDRNQVCVQSKSQTALTAQPLPGSFSVFLHQVCPRKCGEGQ